jgi:hypothetical protein
MSTSTPFPAADSGDDVNPPATDPEDTNPNEHDPDDAVAVNPPSPPIPSNDDEDADQVAGSRATRPVSGNQD